MVNLQLQGDSSSFSLKILTYCLCYFIYSLFYVYWCLTNKRPHWE
ncbi:unnamed protein product [Acanthoscelides obtectus]|uniref:Uncharacterized protein n=1 Tax=Acanthoscelides obtectus TaxID=200917 RepID=A0A9P0LPD7_ACAOB|nr:unnamed protein product [Acanthoscelides obtectus]CAK1620100.1 hypothetical protein AOBTE_LOCUS201 [Acanthoscelides obtectus]